MIEQTTTAEQPIYENVPPTVIRNREEKFRTAKWSRFWIFVANCFFYNMLEHRFFSLKYKNKKLVDDNLNTNYPTIFYAPHCNWWDGIVCYNLQTRLFKRRITMMIEEMNRFPLFNFAGAFPVNKKSAQTAIIALKHGVEVLAKHREVDMWIFPQGIIRPPHYRPIEFQTGMVYMSEKIAKKCGGINLVPVSFQYCFLREHRPEVLVEFDKPIILENYKLDRHEYTRYLESEFQRHCDNHFHEIANGDVTGYEILFKQKYPWYRNLEKYLKSRGMKFYKNSSSRV